MGTIYGQENATLIGACAQLLNSPEDHWGRGLNCQNAPFIINLQHAGLGLLLLRTDAMDEEKPERAPHQGLEFRQDRLEAHQQQSQKVVEDAMASGGFQLESAAEVFNAYADECHQQIDARLEQRRERLACEKGCHHCCSLYVDVTFDEVLSLRRHLLRLPQHLRRVLKQRNLLNCVRIFATHAHEKPVVYHHLKMACMFLTESGTCAIHPIRPLACRHHHSFELEPCKGRNQAVQHEGRLTVGVGIRKAKEALLRPLCEEHPQFTRWKGELHTMLKPFLKDLDA